MTTEISTSAHPASAQRKRKRPQTIEDPLLASDPTAAHHQPPSSTSPTTSYYPRSTSSSYYDPYQHQHPGQQHSQQAQYQPSSAEEDEGFYDDDNLADNSQPTRGRPKPHQPRHRSSSSHHDMSGRGDSPGDDNGLAPPPDLPSSGLNRGFACLGCRKRKSKCDTNRPSCEQCIKAKMQCVYDDRPQKRPTEVLKDKIRDLEEKVRLLESQNPGLAEALAKQQQQQDRPTGQQSASTSKHAASSSSPLAPTAGQSAPGWTASADIDAYGSSARSGSGGQVIPGMSQFMMGATQTYAQNFRAVDPAMFVVARDTSNDPLPPDLDPNELINIFMAHRHQAYCDLSVTRFTQSLSAPPAHQTSASPPPHPDSPHSTPGSLVRPHASLLNAIYLLGAFFSGQPHLAEYEQGLLHRARQGIATALENADGLEDAVRAASLVAMYLYAKGRVLEAYYLACANARFAMGCGMHRVTSPVFTGARGKHGASGAMEEDELSSERTMPLLEEPQNPVELGERIHIWWQVWMVDQCGAISTNLPPALADTKDPLARMDTCFPAEMAQFEPGGILANTFSSTHPPFILPGTGPNGEWEMLRSLYDPAFGDVNMDMGPAGGSASSVMGRTALVAKSIELFSRAWKLSKHDVKDDHFRRAFEATDSAINRFIASLPRLVDDYGNCNHLLFLPHSLAHAAVIQLHWIVAVEHNHLHPSYQNCLNAAIDMLAVIELIQPGDYQYLELHIGTCWKLTADVLYREYSRLRNVDPSEAQMYHEPIDKVQEATKQLSRVFPVLMELWRVQGHS
ncbi:hypothetical protein DL93DRAFT_312570 [Clavulina sp. PMI_390]|nr:hypothetical protein DL93DRAFT_312570 [Clavulina sp. PMI_390]